MTTDTFPGSSLAHGQSIHGTLRKSQRLCVYWWVEPGPCLENQDHTNKTLGFLLADNSVLLSTGMKGQCGHWLSPALSSATHFNLRQGKLLTSLAEKASRQLFLLFINNLFIVNYLLFIGTAQPCSTHLICTQSNSSAVHKSSDNLPLATGHTAKGSYENSEHSGSLGRYPLLEITKEILGCMVPALGATS